MKFKVDDRVRLNRDYDYETGEKILAGAKGTIREVFEHAREYNVKFDDYYPPLRRVEESDLEAEQKDRLAASRHTNANKNIPKTSSSKPNAKRTAASKSKKPKKS